MREARGPAWNGLVAGERRRRPDRRRHAVARAASPGSRRPTGGDRRGELDPAEIHRQPAMDGPRRSSPGVSTAEPYRFCVGTRCGGRRLRLQAFDPAPAPTRGRGGHGPIRTTSTPTRSPATTAPCSRTVPRSRAAGGRDRDGCRPGREGTGVRESASATSCSPRHRARRRSSCVRPPRREPSVVGPRSGRVLVTSQKPRLRRQAERGP